VVCSRKDITRSREELKKIAQVDVKKHSDVEKIVMIDENAKLQK
jgi:hypothetical protein